MYGFYLCETGIVAKFQPTIGHELMKTFTGNSIGRVLLLPDTYKIPKCISSCRSFSQQVSNRNGRINVKIL